MDGSIKFDVSANTAKFEADMGRVKNVASGSANAVGSAFRGLGSLLAGGAIVSGLQNILSKMDDIGDMAKRFGVSAVAIQKVGNAAEMVGTNIDSVARTMNKAGVAANKAAREGGALAEAFARVDIDPAKFAAADLEERVKMVAAAQRAANGDAQKMADLYEVVGVKASNIDFSALAEEMTNVNAASEHTVEILGKANDKLEQMKQNALVVGANLMAGLISGASDFSERIGGILSGVGPKTIAEMSDEELAQRAKANLQREGKLLPDDSTKKVTTMRSYPQNAGMVGIPVQDIPVTEMVPGSNALENKRRIDAEKERIRQMEAGKKPAATEDDGETAVKNTAEEAKFKQYILDLELQIKEAQAAGDSQKAESIGRLKDWTEAAIKYEGDLDMATRDVNASLKERLRLKEAEIAKQQQSIEAELQYAETMAFGTDEAKSKAEWMKIYDEALARGATEDQARRAANAGTYKEQTTQSHQTSGAMPDNLSPSPNFGAAQKKIGENMGRRDTSGYLFGHAQSGDAIRSVELMRGEAAAQKYEAKAAKYEAKGQFDQAYNARVQANRIRENAQRRAKMAEQFREGPSFEDSARTPAEKIEQERRIAQSEKSDSAGQSDPAKIVSDIHKLLTERLPVKVLGA